MSILDLAEKIKDWLVILFWPLFWAHLSLILAFGGLIGYELGSKPGVVVAMPVGQGGASNNDGKNGQSTLDGDKSKRGDLQNNTASSVLAGSGSVVASKNGARYYTPGCAGIKRIKPENLISFSSTAEAESAGYTKAKNCQ